MDVDVGADVDPIKDAQRQLKASVEMADGSMPKQKRVPKNVGVTEGGDI